MLILKKKLARKKYLWNKTKFHKYLERIKYRAETSKTLREGSCIRISNF